ncbi:MAG: hypothetical protein CFE44_04255 [Burkholderiales bacterium PBB4]|nr:MAG: hypothetical protein CFE44_04255 [Burkholderiales bacterium PBB4]
MSALPIVRRGLLALSLWAFGGQVLAHLMPAQQGSVNIVGTAAYVVLAVPVSSMHGADDNRDGRLSDLELLTHRDLVARQVADRFGIFEGDVRTPAQVLQLVAEPDERQLAHPPMATGPDAGTTHFLVMMRHSLQSKNLALRVDTDLFGVMAHEAQLTLKLTQGGLTEAAVLTPTHHSHRFFQPASQVLQDYLALGVTHILLGLDHLLFLLTLIVGAQGWRHWIGVLTGFTVAHSMTLGASMLGLVQASPQWVEPGIAASIVLMAALNLTRAKVQPLWRLGMVASCGLLHGLGFAGSMAQLGLHGIYRATSLIGFNVGIEIGQALFLVLAWGLVRGLQAVLTRRAVASRASPRLAQASGMAASVCAMVLGSFWLLERLGVVRV